MKVVKSDDGGGKDDFVNIQHIATESRKSLRTRVKRDKTKYTRKSKHKGRENW